MQHADDVHDSLRTWALVVSFADRLYMVRFVHRATAARREPYSHPNCRV